MAGASFLLALRFEMFVPGAPPMALASAPACCWRLPPQIALILFVAHRPPPQREVAFMKKPGVQLLVHARPDRGGCVEMGPPF